MVFQTQQSVNALLGGRLTVGVDAAAAAGPVGRQATAATDTSLSAEILSYSRSRGLFAGFALDGASIQIDNLAISGEHAVIVTILNESFLEDLGSTNGTLVNGAPIKRHFLQNGDTVELGKYKLKYINEAVPQATPADFEKTMVLRPDVMRQTAEQMENKAFGDTQVGAAAIGSAVPS